MFSVGLLILFYAIFNNIYFYKPYNYKPLKYTLISCYLHDLFYRICNMPIYNLLALIDPPTINRKSFLNTHTSDIYTINQIEQRTV